ncbi:glycosyltransferase family 2 protein [Planococcus shenhongbingii]|uniref:Glycosyltransferase family 2 protein n=1 Tax=Planococcus shenhongbingii TaxID=3058398 RepID=A0ABT8NAX9_9BACL|nr:glycosyltransferase family 2 protein [Planococcus sp. N017]MDN7244700.1 glycosyltransferase family 2 protein [Planococcus sp. N017]
MVIIPAYNEEDSIVQTVESIKAVTQIDYIVVNDGSTDRTPELLDEHGYHHIDLPINLGIGGAMQTGYRYARDHGYDYAIQLDADGQHNPSDLTNLIDEITETDYDMVIGSRFVEQSAYKGSLPRRIGIYYFYRFIHLLTRMKITDPTSGYRIVNRKIIESFSNYYPTDYPEVEVLVNLSRKNYKIKEIKVEMNQRQGGKSSITPKKSIYYMFKVTYISLVRSVL